MRSLRQALLAMSIALAPPALAGNTTAQHDQRTADAGQQQIQGEQPRLPAKKDGAERGPAQSAGEKALDDRRAGSSKTTRDKDANRAGDSKHPPTAVMDQATPAEKASQSGTSSGRHPPATVMDRATPEQKSPPQRDLSSSSNVK